MSKIGPLMRKHLPLVGAMLIAVLVIPATAAAKKQTPIEQLGFGNFVQCPTENEEAFDCVHSITTGGVFEVGTLKVKITKPIILQGAIPNPFSGKQNIVPAKNGETLSPTPQLLPKGIASVLKQTPGNKFFLKFCKTFPEKPECRVEGAAELMPAGGEIFLFNFIGEQTPGVVLNVRLHLISKALGKKCYFGSPESPILLDLTTGPTSPPPPNESIHGSTGHLSEDSTESILFDNNFEIVDNVFAAPGAQGCGTEGTEEETDQLINEKIGLPAASGFHSTIQLFGEQAITTAAQVRDT